MFIKTYDNSRDSPDTPTTFSKRRDSKEESKTRYLKDNKIYGAVCSFRNKIISRKNTEREQNGKQKQLEEIQKKESSVIKAGYRNIRMRGFKKSAYKQVKEPSIVCATERALIQNSLKNLKQKLSSEEQTKKKKVCIEGTNICKKPQTRKKTEGNSVKKRYQKPQQLVLDLSTKEAPQKEYFRSQTNFANYFPMNYSIFRKLSKNMQENEEPEILRQYRQLTTASRSKSRRKNRQSSSKRKDHKSFDAFESKRLNQFINPWIVENNNNDDEQFF